jgi:hypothetical protein
MLEPLGSFVSSFRAPGVEEVASITLAHIDLSSVGSGSDGQSITSQAAPLTIMSMGNLWSIQINREGDCLIFVKMFTNDLVFVQHLRPPHLHLDSLCGRYWKGLEGDSVGHSWLLEDSVHIFPLPWDSVSS